MLSGTDLNYIGSRLVGLNVEVSNGPFIAKQDKPITNIGIDAFSNTMITGIIFDDWNYVNKIKRIINFILCWENYNINLGSNLLVNIFKFIPVQLETIGNSAFAYCKILKEITIQYGVKTIGNHTFKQCIKLKVLTIDHGVETIGYDVFMMCNSLEKIIIQGSVKIIKGWTLSYCELLKEIIILNGVEHIWDDVFMNCKLLSSITIPNSVKIIGPYMVQQSE